MNKVPCHDIANQLKGDTYLLLVSEGCPFCAQVLDAMSKGQVPLRRETVVVNTDACIEEVDRLINWPATPMIAEFSNGKEVRRGVGVDKILAFDKVTATQTAAVAGEVTPQSPAQATAGTPATSARAEQGENPFNDPLLLEAIGTRK